MKKVHSIFLSMFLMTPLMSMEAPPLPPEDLALLDLLTLHNETVASVRPFSSLDKTIQLIREGMRDETLAEIPTDPESAIIYIGANAKKNGTEDFAIPNEIKRHARSRKYNIGTIIPEVVLAEKGFFLLYDYVFNSPKTRPAVALTTGAVPKDLMSVPLQYHRRIIQELNKMGLHEVNNPRRLAMIQRLQAKFAEEEAEDVQRSFLGDIGQIGLGTGKKLNKTKYLQEAEERDAGRRTVQTEKEQHPLASLLGATGAAPKPKPSFTPPPPVATPPVDPLAGLTEEQKAEVETKIASMGLGSLPITAPPVIALINKYKETKGITAPTASAGPMGGGLFAGLADAAKKDRKAAVDAVDKPKTPAKRGDSDGGGESGGARPKPKFSPPQAVAAPLVDPLAGLTEEQKEEVRAKIALTGLGHLPLTTPPVAAVINKYKTEKGITAPTASAGPMGGGLLGALKAVPQKDRTAALAGLGKPKTPSKSEGGDSGKGTGAPGGSTPVAAQFVVSPEALKQTNRGSGTAFDADRIKEDARRVREAREKKAAEDAAREAAKGPPRPNFVIPVKPKPVPGSVVPPPPPMTVTSGGRPPATTTGWMAKKPTAAASGGSKPPVAATMAVPERAAIDEEKLDAIITSLAKSFPADPVKEETVRQGYLSALATQEPISYLTQQIWENLEKFNRAANAIFRTQAMRAIKVAMDMLAERGDTRPLREIAGFDTDPGVGVVSGDGDKD